MTTGGRSLTDGPGGAASRAQTSLPAVALALLVLSVVTVVGLAIGEGAIAAADREPDDRRVASSLAERLVAPTSPATVRANVVNATAVRRLDAERLREQYPVSTDAEAVRIRIDGTTAVETGDPEVGTTVRRLVVVAHGQERTITPPLGRKRALTLPRRASRATLAVAPPGDATVETVRANDRVVLHDPTGLNGTYDVSLSRFETTTLRFDGGGSLPQGSVEVRYEPLRTTRATLAVTVDV